MEAVTNTTTTSQAETKWYVLRVISGKEKKVKEYLDKEISRGGWSELVKQVFLPVEKVYKVAAGKKSNARTQLLSWLCNDRDSRGKIK